MKLLRDEKKIYWLETAFQMLFVIYLSLGCSSLTNGLPIISLFMWPCYGLAALLLCIRLFNWKRYFRMPGLGFLLGMCAICAISILVNFRYDLKRNVTYLIYWAVCFFLFFTHSDQITSQQAKKRFVLLGHLVCAVAFVLAAISLVMLVNLYSETVEINGTKLIRGFTDGRLYGAYRTPNVGAVMASVAIMLSVHFIRAYKKGLYTAVAVVNILTQFLYIVFSDSRSGQVALALSGAVYFALVAAASPRLKRGAVKNGLVLVLTAIIGLCLFYAPKATQTAYNNILTHMARQSASAPATSQDETEATETEPTETEPTEPPVDLDKWVVDRGYDLSGDISNRRFDVWKSGLEIFMEEPWLGTSFAGFLPYAIEHLPDTYIVTNDYMQLNTLDNDFMNLLVSNGIFAFLAFVAFVIVLLVYVFRGIATMEKPDFDLPVVMSLCAASASFSLFASGVLYMQEPFAVMFWLALGVIVTIIRQSKKESQ